MRLEHIETLDDPRVDDYLRLTELQLRCRLEPKKGIFIAESPTVIGLALDAGIETLSFLTGEQWLMAVEPLARRAEKIAGHEVPVFTGPAEQLESLTGFNLTRGILAAMRRLPLPKPEELLSATNARHIAVLDGIVNHTNVGAIFRSAAALGTDAILVTPDCCDPLYRRAARVSMGTVFQIPWTRIGADVHEWHREGLARLHALGYTTCAMALSEDALPLDDPRLHDPERLALIFGTEGPGLTRHTIEGCDHVARIPMDHNVDSLNVAAASAVAFWELFKH